MFRAYGGRPHWGKIHAATAAAELAPHYEHWDHFWRLRAELDPEGRFLNEHLRTIGGVAPSGLVPCQAIPQQVRSRGLTSRAAP